ncbi:MAG: hypothetical protein C0483_22600 [Pirellula sp.]|nr:hypothetical protein [Pirellula sp.]
MLRIVDNDPGDTAPEPRTRRLWTVCCVVFFLGPAMYGFGTKFYELVRVFQGDSTGAFAVTPIVNYLLAGCGFLMLFAWAARNGMFRDIERAKFEMLENEHKLDEIKNFAPSHTYAASSRR